MSGNIKRAVRFGITRLNKVIDLAAIEKSNVYALFEITMLENGCEAYIRNPAAGVNQQEHAFRAKKST